MIVNHTKDESTPATLRIYFRQGSTAAAPSEPSPSDPSSTRGKHQHVPQTLQLRSSTTGESPAPAPEGDERVVTLDVKGQDTQRILEDLLERTGAVPVVPTAAEELEMQEVAERRERAKVDREVMRKHLEQQKREEALMAQARSEAAALKDAL
jgi:large subunit ribosomal protein MRP49